MSGQIEDRGTAADVNPANLKDKDDVGEHDEAGVAAVTIDRPRQELYQFWRGFENLASVMHNVISITSIDDERSHWVVQGLNGDVEWDARVTEDIPGQRIAWQAVEDAEVKNSGWVEFRDGPPGRGTEVRAFLSYDPPMGPLGDLTAKALQKDPITLARIELRRFKQFMETGEIATAEAPANPSAE